MLCLCCYYVIQTTTPQLSSACWRASRWCKNLTQSSWDCTMKKVCRDGDALSREQKSQRGFLWGWKTKVWISWIFNPLDWNTRRPFSCVLTATEARGVTKSPSGPQVGAPSSWSRYNLQRSPWTIHIFTLWSNSNALADTWSCFCHSADLWHIPLLVSDKDISLEIYFAPGIIGDAMTLSCYSWNNDKFSRVVFYKNDQVLADSTSLTHRIGSVKEADQGTYKCDATIDTSQHRSDAQELFVQGKSVKKPDAFNGFSTSLLTRVHLFQRLLWELWFLEFSDCRAHVHVATAGLTTYGLRSLRAVDLRGFQSATKAWIQKRVVPTHAWPSGVLEEV